MSPEICFSHYSHIRHSLSLVMVYIYICIFSLLRNIIARCTHSSTLSLCLSFIFFILFFFFFFLIYDIEDEEVVQSAIQVAQTSYCDLLRQMSSSLQIKKDRNQHGDSLRDMIQNRRNLLSTIRSIHSARDVARSVPPLFISLCPFSFWLNMN